jgi:hypothetical protein
MVLRRAEASSLAPCHSVEHRVSVVARTPLTDMNFDESSFAGHSPNQRRSTAHATRNDHALRDTKADSGERGRVYSRTGSPVPVRARSGDRCGENLFHCCCRVTKPQVSGPDRVICTSELISLGSLNVADVEPGAVGPLADQEHLRHPAVRRSPHSPPYQRKIVAA